MMKSCLFDIILRNNLFDSKTECQRYYKVGRMDMLFSLVSEGKIELDEAAEFTGMTWGEAFDMLQGWQEAQRL
ncbi:MAG: hypothetical protein K2N34_10345 [Lachnospiraceae bacterium]|nr:hypothetical protein [Lachnospiraceae bacterium]